jgi:small conductance mechanosensitive channel
VYPPPFLHVFYGRGGRGHFDLTGADGTVSAQQKSGKLMTAMEKMWSAIQAWWWHVVALGPAALMINAGLTIAAIAVAVAVAWVVNWLVTRAVARLPHAAAGHGFKNARALQLTRWVLRVVITATAIMMIAGIWGIDILAWASQGEGQRIATTTMRVVTVLVLTAIALEGVGLFTRVTLHRLHSDGGDPRRRAQLETLGPIIRRILQTVIMVLALMTLLSQVGVQIGPILAGAGVAGIAVGFGAQTLVKDFFTGFFLLVEDIVAIGDVVQIQAFSGEVEDMTLRTIRLRDADGTLHIFPYGEAQIIHNMTKTFSFAAVDLPVKIDTDVDRAMQIMRDTCALLRKDKDYGPLISDDMDIAGVDLLSDVGVILKGRIRTVPTERWRVLREYNRRIKRAFDEAGIVITHK